MGSLEKKQIGFSLIFTFALLAAGCGVQTPAIPTAAIPTTAPTPIHSLAPAPTTAPRLKISTTPGPPGWCSPGGQMSGDFLVIGYLPDYRILNPAWGNCMTDIIYFSAEPLANGELDAHRLNPNTLQSLREVKELYGTRIHISIGGYGRSGYFSEMVTNQKARANFVENLIQFCQQNNLDGVDFDWEFPANEAETEGYLALISEVQQGGLLVSVALYPSEEVDFQPYAVADRIHIMSYERGLRHATFEQAVQDLDLFANQGIPEEKLVLGIPFYARQTTSPYHHFAYSQIIEQYGPPAEIDEVDEIYFNGITTTQRKTCYSSQNKYGGVMIWELGQDTQDETSLLRAIYQAATSGCDPR